MAIATHVAVPQRALISNESNGAQSQVIDIHVIDKESGEPMPRVRLRIGKENFSTRLDGHSHIPDHYDPGAILEVSFVGYETQTFSWHQVRAKQPFIIRLSPAVHALGEVTVQGQRTLFSENAIATQLAAPDLHQAVGRSFGEMLEQVPGVSLIKSGTSVAKPVIHGMHSNRILIVSNGVRQRGQQWGADHAPELDMQMADHVGVLKGADAVRFGSEALGGVIELSSAPLPYTTTGLHGHLSTLYGSNGRMSASTGMVEGQMPLVPGLAFRLQGTAIFSGDRSTPNYLLNNTGEQELDFSAMLGYKRKNVELDLFYSRFQTKIGTLYSAQMGDVDLVKERIEIGRPVEILPFSRKIDVPNQHVVHHLTRLHGAYTQPVVGKVELSAGTQLDLRDEYHNRRNNLSGVPALSLTLRSLQADAKWSKQFGEHVNALSGFQWARSNNSNTPGTGVVPIIPNYVETNVGAYALARYDGERWGAEGGVRYDYMDADATGIDRYGDRYGSHRTFHNVTYNAGAHYYVSDKLSLTTNIGMAWRPPHVHELYSDGPDHASGIYLQGDSTMVSEKSTKWITAVEYKHRGVRVALEGYLQWVDGFIYDEPQHQFRTVVSGAYPLFVYKQTEAYFRGLDLVGELPITGHLRYHAQASMLWAGERSTGRYLPYMPPFRWNHNLSFTWHHWAFLSDLSLELHHTFVAKQTRFDPMSDLTNDTPPAYHLFDLKAGATLFANHGRSLRCNLQIDNVFNKEYKDYTNRFRYFAHELGRDLRLSLYYNF